MLGLEAFDESVPSVEELPFKEAKARVADRWAESTVRMALGACGGNVSKAARKLQMSRTALIRLINRYGINGEAGAQNDA